MATTSRGLVCTAQRPRLADIAAASQPRASHAALRTAQQLHLPHLQCYPATSLLPVLLHARGTLTLSACDLGARQASRACPCWPPLALLLSAPASDSPATFPAMLLHCRHCNKPKQSSSPWAGAPRARHAASRAPARSLPPAAVLPLLPLSHGATSLLGAVLVAHACTSCTAICATSSSSGFRLALLPWPCSRGTTFSCHRSSSCI